jgi:RIG-I receptor C-terminal domain
VRPSIFFYRIAETKELTGRTNDPFYRRICTVMKQIEDRMRESEHATDLLKDQPNALKAPNERGSDRYTQWINGLEKPIAHVVHSQLSRRFLVSCQRSLMVGYQSSLTSVNYVAAITVFLLFAIPVGVCEQSLQILLCSSAVALQTITC